MKKKKREVMRLNRIIGSKKGKFIIILIITLFFLCLANYFINLLGNISAIAEDISNYKQYMGIRNIFPRMEFFTNPNIRIMYIVVIIAILGIDAYWYYKIDVYISDNNMNMENKGDSKFTTIEELQAQFKAIPEREARFPGRGGFPVCHYNGKKYIDDSPVNNLVFGTTRMGKGETIIFNMIDNFSRAEQQSSLVVLDPKLELYPSSYDTLTARGYKCYLFNLIELSLSIGINPLQLVVDAYKEKRYSDAETLCSSVAYAIYNSKNESVKSDDNFFIGNAISAFCAMVLSQIEDCAAADEVLDKRIRGYWKKKQEAFKVLNEDTQKDAIKVWEEKKQEKGDMLKLVRAVRYIPDYEEYVPVDTNLKKVNIFSVIVTFSELAQAVIDENTTKLDVYFTNKPAGDRNKLRYASIKVAGDRTKGSVFSTVLNDLSVFIDEAVAKMTAESTFNLRDIGFGDQPVAFFIGFPEYDKSKHFLVSLIIQQIYYVLARSATFEKGQRCKRDVEFLLDEAGNIPAIDGLSSIITMCLSRGISFTLFLQSYTQLNTIYGDSANTIIENCGNQMFLGTPKEDTAQEFVKLIGYETIMTVSRMGKKLSLRKNITESFEEKPLINANQLMELREGECVIKRIAKRKDLKGRDVRPRPIYCNIDDGTAIKYRYTYMSEEFPSDISFRDIPMETRDHINISERIWDPEESFRMQIYKEVSIGVLETCPLIIDQLCFGLNVSSPEELQQYGINPALQINEFIQRIYDIEELEETTVDTIMHMVEKGVA